MSVQTDIKADRLPGEKRVILDGVSWATYEHLLSDFAGRSSPRFTYDRGALEIMTPLPEHERLNRTIDIFISTIAEELDMDYEDLGSTTFKREDLKRGFEPDSCFYFRHAVEMRGKKKIDLAVDPPPELVLEIDITNDSLNKFPIYAAMGVSEIWRHDGEKLAIYRLSGESYIESSNSLVFPFLTGGHICDFYEKGETMTRSALMKSFRTWIREQIVR